MKKLIMALAFIAVTIGNAAIAGPGGRTSTHVSKRLLKKNTWEPQMLHWYVYDEYIKVDFPLAVCSWLAFIVRMAGC